VRDLYIMRDARSPVGYASTEVASSSMTVLTKLYVDPEKRNLGHGTALLRLVCRDADRERRHLGLNFEPHSGMDRERLKKLFLNHGFELIAGESALLRVNHER